VTTSAATYRAVVLDRSRRLAYRDVVAFSEDEARSRLSADGLTCLRVQSYGRDKGSSRGLLVLSRQTFDHSVFASDLATLLRAGVVLTEALDVLQQRETSWDDRQILNGLIGALRDGMSLSESMARAGGFPTILVATVSASEQTGDLASGLSRFADYGRSVRQLRDKVIGACVYPLLLLVVGGAIGLLLLTVIVPRFSRLLDTTSRDMPMFSEWLFTWGRLADAHPIVPIALVALSLLGCGSMAAALRDPQARKTLLSKVPYLSRVTRDFQHLQLYRTTGILVSRGIPINKALVLAGELLSPADKARLSEGIGFMEEGRPVSSALAACGLSDPVACSMLAVADRSGSLADMLDKVADFYESVLGRRLDLTARLVEPLLMIVIGFVIGAIVLMMYLPIFDLASQVS
jgi:general secretion pathway protein F